MVGAPSIGSQLKMLELLRSRGLVLAGTDQRVLRYLEFRRLARALPLYHPRTGKAVVARAWQITDAGVAVVLQVGKPAARRRPALTASQQIDIEEAIAAASSGGEPDAAPLPDPDAPTAGAVDVSAPKAAQSRQRARGRKPEHAHV